MTTDTLLADIIGALDRSGVPDVRFSDHRGEYWALCPFHHDMHPKNLSVSARSHNCLACAMTASDADELRSFWKLGCATRLSTVTRRPRAATTCCFRREVTTMRLTLVSTGMVLDEVVIGGTWNRGMIGGTVAVVGTSRFEQGQRICWPFHADDWTEIEKVSELAAGQ